MNSAGKTMNVRQQMSAVAVATGIVIILLFPLLWMASLSIRPVAEIWSLPLPWFPQDPTLEPYRGIFRPRSTVGNWLRFFLNSMIVSVGSTLVVTFLGTLMGYSMSRSGSGKWVARGLFTIIIFQLLNGPGLVVPVYAAVSALGLYDTLIGYALVVTMFHIPLGVLLGYSFAQAVPIDLDEAASVDGCSPWQTFRMIYLPLARVGMLTIALISLIIIWGEYPFAIALLESRDNLTAPIALVTLISGQDTQWGEASAASVLMSLPLLVVLLSFQRHIVSGLTTGAVK